jgi:signal transduction histidine kinase
MRSVLGAVADRRTWYGLVYLIVAAPLALAGFVFTVVSFALGIGLAVTFVGLPLLGASAFVVRGFGALDRELARGLLDLDVTPPPPFERGRGVLGWLQSALRDPVAWRARLYLVLKFPLGMVGWYFSLLVGLTGVAWLTYPLWWQLSGPGRLQSNIFLDIGTLVLHGSNYNPRHLPHRLSVHYGDSFYVDTWPKALLLMAMGLVLIFLMPWVVRGFAWVHRLLVRSLLGATRADERVQQLEAARAQVADDAATTLRRVERDLHDGTQAQLATLAMTLGQAKEKLEHREGVPYDPEGALDLVDAAHRHAREALVELRDIARGIHPPALDVGLDAALATLVSRSAVPATLSSNLNGGNPRPSKAIETIAYFSVAELLANAAKHSKARAIEVNASIEGDRLALSVIDDGIGGAAPRTGSGLPGLANRVRAVDGSFTLTSPEGGPTRVHIELPMHA